MAINIIFVSIDPLHSPADGIDCFQRFLFSFVIRFCYVFFSLPSFSLCWMINLQAHAENYAKDINIWRVNDAQWKTKTERTIHTISYLMRPGVISFNEIMLFVELFTDNNRWQWIKQMNIDKSGTRDKLYDWKKVRARERNVNNNCIENSHMHIDFHFICKPLRLILIWQFGGRKWPFLRRILFYLAFGSVTTDYSMNYDAQMRERASNQENKKKVSKTESEKKKGSVYALV